MFICRKLQSTWSNDWNLITKRWVVLRTKDDTDKCRNAAEYIMEAAEPAPEMIRALDRNLK